MFSTIKDSIPHIQEIERNHPEIIELRKLAKEAHKSVELPAVLSEVALKMCGYMAVFGGTVAGLMAEANDAYSHRKFRLMGPYHALEGTIKDREAQALEKTFEEHRQEMIKKYIADFYKSLYDDFDREIMVIQSRLKILAKEMQ
jgi:hypothetical protein